jgi:hypothetical protein
LSYLGTGVSRIPKIVYFLEYYIGMDDWHAVMSDVGALMYVVLREAEECVPHGELVGTNECVTL